MTHLLIKKSLACCFTATKQKIHKTQRWHEWMRRDVGVGRCECSAAGETLSRPSIQSPLCGDLLTSRLSGAHSHLTKHSAAPDGALWKYTDDNTNTEHWTPRQRGQKPPTPSDSTGPHTPGSKPQYTRLSVDLCGWRGQELAQSASGVTIIKPGAGKCMQAALSHQAVQRIVA